MKTAIYDPVRIWRWLVLAILTGTLAGCSGLRSFEYTEGHEIQPGPGLVSGVDGEFVLYTRNSTDTAE